MKADVRTQLSKLIPKLYDAREEFYQVAFGQHARQQLGNPCTEQQVKALERKLRYTLPPSYRELLLLHDGWKGFQGDADLLSLAQRSDKGIVRRIQSLKEVMRDLEEPYNPDNLLIVGGNDSTYVVYLDLDTRRPDGEMDVVEYGYEEGELARHPDMVAFLQSQYDDIQDSIKDEKGADADEDEDEDEDEVEE
jgi:SMI1 / KNR4 family (SUKH-1)